MSERINDTINYAIDLGTSDSLIACSKSNETIIIKNHETKENFTPSIVAMNETETVVGQKAKKILLEDPENAISEFKLNMGFPAAFQFKDSGKKMLPEELSATVIKDLMKSAYQQLNEKVEYAVITVPANSNPLKTKATLEAAKLAGLRKVYLMLEPIAASVAYGLQADDQKQTWLIYDLGGGTFDASIVRPNGEEIEVLSTSGADNIGGKIFDWQIVELFSQKIRKELNLEDFDRNNPTYSKVFSKLKYEAEKAKKELNNYDEVALQIENLFDGYAFNYTLTVNQLREIMNIFLENTIDICYSLLEESNLTLEDVDKLILVGGSTLSRVVQEILSEEFDVPLENGLNPLTVVVEGAVIYANSISKPQIPPKEENFSLVLSYEKISTSSTFDLTGRIISSDENFSFLGFTLEIYNTDTQKIIIPDIDGTFKTTIQANKKINEYSIRVFDEKTEVKIDENSPNTIRYIKSLKPAVNTLPQSIRLGLNDNNTKVIADKGVQIGYDNDVTVFTDNDLTLENPIDIPIYYGENNKIQNNNLLGKIHISWNDLKQNLPKDSQINIQLHIENLDNIEFNVFIPNMNQELTDTFEFNTNTIEYSQLVDNHEKIINNFDEYENYSENNEVVLIVKKIEKSLDFLNVLMKLAQDDKTIIHTCNDYMNTINGYMEEIEEVIKIDKLKDNIDGKILAYNHIIMALDDREEMKKYATIKDEYEKCDKDNYEELYAIYQKLIENYTILYSKDVLKETFYKLRYDGIFIEEEANRLIEEGLDCLKTNDYTKLYEITKRLYVMDNRNTSNYISDVYAL